MIGVTQVYFEEMSFGKFIRVPLTVIHLINWFTIRIFATCLPHIVFPIISNLFPELEIGYCACHQVMCKAKLLQKGDEKMMMAKT